MARKGGALSPVRCARVLSPERGEEETKKTFFRSFLFCEKEKEHKRKNYGVYLIYSPQVCFRYRYAIAGSHQSRRRLTTSNRNGSPAPRGSELPYEAVSAVQTKLYPRWRQRVLRLDVPFFAVVPTVNFAKQNSKTKGAVRRRFSRGSKRRALTNLLISPQSDRAARSSASFGIFSCRSKKSTPVQLKKNFPREECRSRAVFPHIDKIH